ncbi:MAG: hypothetical protein O2954_12040, partial [bacterium]|nr:hypothetical protein [bacterium]
MQKIGTSEKVEFSLRRCSFLIVCVLAVFLTGCGSDKPTQTVDDSGGGTSEPTSLCSDTPGTICTWAGTGDAGFDGGGNSLLRSSFYWPTDLTITPTGRTYILDWNNHRVRRLTDTGTLETVIGTGFVGDGPYDESELIPPGALGETVNLNHPTHLIQLSDGTILLTAWHNHKLRIYNPSTNRVRVYSGDTPGYAGDGGPAQNALLNQPTQTVLGPDNQSLYILDMRNQRVRKVSPNGMITTVVGTGVAGFSGDGGPPDQAQLSFPTGSNPQPGGALV